ncbi:MAG: CYTH domain-containing protein, partial [Pseudomonadota bacterium]
MPLETELKLSIDSADIDALKQHPHVQAVVDTFQQKQLTGYYFDTPNHELRQLKISLRVRREGNKWVQAVKAKGQSVGGMHQRQEWEADVAGLQPEFDVLPE